MVLVNSPVYCPSSPRCGTRQFPGALDDQVSPDCEIMGLSSQPSRLVLPELACHNDIETTYVAAPQHLHRMFVVIASGVSFGIRFDPQAVVSAIWDEVHNAGYRLIAVQRRRAVRHDVDTLDGYGGNERVYVLVHQPFSIHKRQRGTGAETPQVDTCGAGIGALNRIGDCGGTAVHERQILHNLANVHRAFGFQILCRKLCNRRGLRETFSTPDVRTGYDNLL